MNGGAGVPRAGVQPPRRMRCMWAAMLFAALGASASAAPGTAPERLAAGFANGLIVQLRAAAPHEADDGEHAPEGRAAALAADGRAQIQRLLGAAGLSPASMRPVGRAAQLLDFGRPLPPDEAAALADRLLARPEVEWVVPNERERLLHTPDDPMFPASAGSSGQWWLFPATGSNANVAADRRRGVPGIQLAWPLAPDEPAPVVAVLDTGITSHPELAGRVLPGHDFVSDLDVANDGDGRDADPSDPGDWVSQSDKDTRPGVFGSCEVRSSSWHGTGIAGMLAAATHNGQGVAALNWHGRLLPVRVAGKCGADVADIVDGMRWAAGLKVAGVPLNRHPARVVSISFGSSAPCNAAYQSAILELANARGAVVVAAAGNERASPSRPANCERVLGVAALNRDGFKANYSNFGPELAIATVGGDASSEGAWGPLLGDDGLLTLDNRGQHRPGLPGYSRAFGSSFAAPVAAGVVGLMLSVNPTLTASELVHGVRVSARPHVTSPKMDSCSAQHNGRCICTAATCGAGILDAPQALQFAIDPASYVPPAWPAVAIDNAELDAALALGGDPRGGESAAAAPAGEGAGGGGGALGLGWLMALAGAVAALRRQRPSDRGSKVAIELSQPDAAACGGSD